MVKGNVMSVVIGKSVRNCYNLLVAVVGIDESDVYCCCKRCGRWLNLLVKLAGIGGCGWN
jgi:hypothetical protein